MNKYQLLFDEEPQKIGESWQTTGLLTALDTAGRENTFRVLASGASCGVVQEFIMAQKFNCSIKPEVIHSPLVSSDKNSIDRASQSFIFGSLRAPLTVSISPLQVQSPEPYQVFYHFDVIQSAKELSDDDNDEDVAMSFSSEEFLSGKPWPRLVLRASEMQVTCELLSGEVAVRLIEKNGGKQIGPVPINQPKKQIRVPENPLKTQSGAEGEWLVEVTRSKLANTSECVVSWADLTIKLTSRQPTI